MTLKSAQLTLLLKGLVQGKFYLNELDVIAVAHLQKKKRSFGLPGPCRSLRELKKKGGKTESKVIGQELVGTLKVIAQQPLKVHVLSILRTLQVVLN